jgi:hypothetical protein
MTVGARLGLAHVVRDGLVTGSTPGAPIGLHLGLEHVPPALHQLVPNQLLESLEVGVVAVVELLDDLG